MNYEKAEGKEEDASLLGAERALELVPRRAGEVNGQYADRIAQITRYLTFRNLPITPENIVGAEKGIGMTKEFFKSYSIFRERTLFIAGVSTDATAEGEKYSQFTKEDVTGPIKERSQAFESISGLSPTLEATRASAEGARSRALQEIRTSREESITVIFNAHGGGTEISLGEVGDDGLARNDTLSNISVTDLASAFIARYDTIRKSGSETPDVLILANCYSGTFALSFLAELRKRNAPVPIIVTATESGQSGLVTFQHDLSELVKQNPTVGGFVRHYSQTNLGFGSNPIIFLPDPTNTSIPVPVAENRTTHIVRDV